MDQNNDPNIVIDPLDEYPVLEEKVESTFEEIEHFGENDEKAQTEAPPQGLLNPLPTLPPLPKKE